jgi:sphingomyelin phosphodiesterase 2
MTRISVASMNIRGIPLTGSRLTARCRAIGAFFEASDADVVCLQEVQTYYHLAQLSRRMRSFRHVSYRRALPGPAGDVVTFSRRPVVSTAYRGFGVPPAAPGIPALVRRGARLKGVLVTQLTDPAVSVINTHPQANRDGDWSAANRFYPIHVAQLTTLARVTDSTAAPMVVCGDFNIDRDSDLFGEFIQHTGLEDAFGGNCPPTFRAEYLPAGATPHTIDFILTAGGIKAESAEVLFSGEQVVSDHLGLRAELQLPGT